MKIICLCWINRKRDCRGDQAVEVNVVEESSVVEGGGQSDTEDN